MRKHQQSAQIWPVLCLATMQRQKLDKATLLSLLSLSDKELNDALMPIKAYCHVNNLPNLVQILAGSELILSESLFDFDWIKFGTPLAEDLLFASKVHSTAA
jgi:hypothetical protein